MPLDTLLALVYSQATNLVLSDRTMSWLPLLKDDFLSSRSDKYVCAEECYAEIGGRSARVELGKLQYRHTQFHRPTRRGLQAIAVFALTITSAISAFAQAPIAIDFSSETSRSDTVTRLLNRSLTLKAEAEAQARFNGWPIIGETEDGFFELMRLENGRPVYYITTNVNAAISSAADKVRNTAPFSVDGTGVTVGIWDGGDVLTTHQELTGRVALFDSVGTSDHATHVAGTIAAAGVDSFAEGMAPGALIDSYNFLNDEAEMASRAASFAGESGKLYISNHSYSFITGWTFGDFSGNIGPHWFGVFGDREDSLFGRYLNDWDAIAEAAPYYLPIKSAGNDRNDSAPSQDTTYYYLDGGWQSKAYDSATDPFDDGYDNGGFDTIPGHGNGKNVLTVGAVSDAVSAGVRDPSAGTMSSFSGWGPTDDGRIKPDVVGNGISLYSSIGTSDSSYANFSGTSMSAPNVTGSAALLVDYYDELFPGQVMRASTLKGLLIHTADDVGNAGPDYSYGWGLVDTEAAATQMMRNSESPDSYPLLESNLADSTIHSLVFTWDGVSPIRATICWTDPAATAGSGLDNTTLKLVNDLDLRVHGPGGSPTYSPYVLDPSNPAAPATTGDNFRDNVEQVYIASPGTPGMYEVVVSHKSTLSGGSQIYSLILDGAASQLRVTPSNGLSTSGTQGAIGEVSQAYALKIISGVGIGWTASISESWATLSKTSGTVGAGTDDSVTVTIESMRANQLATGSYFDTLVITNTDSGETSSRQIALTVGPRSNTVYSFPLDSDPGWTTQGQWTFGIPQGLGSAAGDPSSGHTGSNVYGYNLFGDYSNGLAERNLTTTALNFSGASGVTLTFWRWLGIESSLYDHASVRVSADGSSWTTIWNHTGDFFSDTGWVQQSFDISAVADGESTVFVRWVMGTTDSSVTYPGWNIDDVTFDAVIGIPSVAWVDFADLGSNQIGTQSEPFIDLLPAVIALVTDGSGVVKIKGNTAVSDTDLTGVLLKPMTIQAIGGTVRIGVP